MAEFTAIFEPAPEGGYTALIPEVPGAVSEGEMVLEAMTEILEYRRDEPLRLRTPDSVVERRAIVA